MIEETVKGWAAFKFPPINLWNYPKQYSDWALDYELMRDKELIKEEI